MRTENDKQQRVYRYVDSLYAQDDALLTEIRSEAQKLQKEGICVHAHEARFLQFLITAMGIETIVEIGTFVGYSALWMARALRESGQLWTIEKDPDHAERANAFFQKSEVAQKITSLCGDAPEILKSLADRAPFDMVFIDANKAAYLDYLLWAEKNLKSGGLVVADNTLLFGKVLSEELPEGASRKQWQKMREFNERVADQKLYEGLLLPTQEGLTVAIKK